MKNSQYLKSITSEDATMKEFVATLAHELRNPLATILTSIELLELRGTKQEEVPEVLQTIEERTLAMVSLLNDLVNPPRISQKKPEN